MSQVEIRLGSVVEDINFSVLVGRHGSRVNIEIGVEFLDGDLQAAVFEEGADGGGGKSLSEGGDNPSSYKDVFHAGDRLIFFRVLIRVQGRKERFELGDLLGSVESHGLIVGHNNPDTGAVFEGAELFQLFGLLELTRRPLDELLEKVAVVSVESHVPQGNKGVGFAPKVWEGAPGEVEGESLAISDNFYDVRILELSKVGHWVGSSNHLEVGMRLHRLCQGVDESRRYKGFVSLNVDYVAESGMALNRFRDPVRSGEVIRRGHGYLCSEGEGFLLNPRIISGDEQQIELFTLFHPLEYVSQKALTREEMEGFSGEARGSPSGGDNTSDLGCRSLCRHLDE